MKNTLIAGSLALATFSASAALADINLSGNARMGVVHTEPSADVDNQTQLDSRVRFTVEGSGETDTGLSFGAAMRIDQSGQGGTANNDSTVFFGNEAFTVTFGDVDSAIKTAVGDVAGVGYTGIGNNHEVGYLGVDTTAASVAVGAGPVSVYLSAGQRQVNSDDNTMSVGAQFDVSGVSLAAGYAEDGAVTQTALSAGIDVAGIGVNAVYVDNDAHATVDAEYAASASYSIDNVTLVGFYREVENLNNVNDTYTGVGASYNLGGGATLAGGIVDQDGTNRMDLGLKFAF